MGLEEFENWEQNISIISKKLNRKQIIELLMFFFEMSEMPEIITINRQKIEINGFLLLKKKLFKFEISFLPNDRKTEVILRLKYGKTKIEDVEEMETNEYDDRIDIYLAENKQYLFSIYF